MVVAEVPLWVVHSTGGDSKVEASSDVTAHRASESLSLLESVGGGSKQAAIYSIDGHPDGSKFATGGGDGTVRIWDASFLFAKHRGKYDGGTYKSSGGESLSESAIASTGEEDNAAGSDTTPTEPVHDLNQLVRRKKDGPTPATTALGAFLEKATPLAATSPQRLKKDSHHHHRLLCALSAHTGSSVLAVRFSNSGQYLASAGDDAVVCIYARSSAAATNGNLEQHSHVEHWARIKLCRGHTLDVVGLAWAPDDSHLVSCSLDSDAPIIVWKLTDLTKERRSNSSVLQNPYKILGKGIHTSTVKGVTFDPAGTYLASSGDDPAVCIWRAHDDWGLEKRIDHGIFRKWKEDNMQELSSQTMFRRLDWSTDGTYICSTNATVKNKHVASTISREGWSTPSDNSAAAGAANLVGHKQPVVVSRHCPRLLDTRKASGDNRDEDDDDEPDYATLVALGDKKGFVTVWSTRKSRPLFKLQCSESRSTVTDLAWSRATKGEDMILLVSLLDGNIVALRFRIPTELGPLLSQAKQNRVFQLRYGLDLDDDNLLGRRRRFVGDRSGPKLIENTLQLTLEDLEDELKGIDNGEAAGNATSSSDDLPINQLGSPMTVRFLQSESRVKGKKRIRPVLMKVGTEPRGKRSKGNPNGDNGKKKRNMDPTKEALDAAAKAAFAAEGLCAVSPKRDGQKHKQDISEGTGLRNHVQSTAHPHEHHVRHGAVPSIAHFGISLIPHSTLRIHSVELPVERASVETNEHNGVNGMKPVADCTNTTQIPTGSSGLQVLCTTLSISKGGKALWRDEIAGTSCSAIAAARHLLAVGTEDGSVYLYGTSPSLGWTCASAVRSHPPLILGQAIISLQLKEAVSSRQLEMLVVTADGSFGVYRLLPELNLCYKGSILPAMTHMILSSSGTLHSDSVLPKLARIQLTDSKHLLLILSLQASSSRSHGSGNGSSTTSHSVGVGGGLQAFVYDRSMELWMRVGDSRFILSDFYSTLPNTKISANGILFKMEDAVRSGAVMSSLKPSYRGRDGHSAAMYRHGEDSGGNKMVTRSHCEDRMACAAALGSADEFRNWLLLYIRALAMGGHVDHLRLLVDMLLGCDGGSSSTWWLSFAPDILNLNCKAMVRTLVIPEMSKNRALQRVTNEIAMQLELG